MIEIRKAVETDAHALTELGKTTFIETFAKYNKQEDMDFYVAKTFSTDKQLKELRDPNRWIEMAWAGNQAVGFVHLVKNNPNPCVSGPKPIELLRLYVDSRWHGKGVGPALMERSIQIARMEGFQTLWLCVWERNFRAQAFYEKCGFAPVGETIFHLGADRQVDWVLARGV